MRLRRLVSSLTIAGLAVAGFGVSVAGAAPSPASKSADLPVDSINHSENVEFLGNTPHSGPLTDGYGTDLAFQGDNAFVGNYNGFVIYDISKPAKPAMVAQVSCPGSQNDISVSGDLLFLSTDSSRSDDSCASTTLSATQKEAWEGIKIFDISDPTDPQYIKSVETSCGSHTHTILPKLRSVYVYVSSYSPSSTYPDCQAPHDKISIIDVPIANPTAAKVVRTPVLFPGGGYTNTSGCHDITVYPAKNLAAGACMGDGVIMDISNPIRPKVIDRVRDTTNFAFWHSATFNQDATKVVFTDELGGGGAATCNADVGPTRGANGIYDLSADYQLSFKSYYKIPRMQSDTENCVAHNGSLIPIKGRDVMVQSWYQGGISFWDFTDSTAPKEIGFFERGPISTDNLVLGGTWSAYYYNGTVFSSDIAKGFDVVRIKDADLKPAARVKMAELNVQSQPLYAIR